MKDNISRDYGTSDEANARIHELEAQLGIPRSNDAEDICSAWDRLSILEELAVAKQPAKGTTSTVQTLPPISTGKPLVGLARAIAANQPTTRSK